MNEVPEYKRKIDQLVGRLMQYIKHNDLSEKGKDNLKTLIEDISRLDTEKVAESTIDKIFKKSKIINAAKSNPDIKFIGENFNYKELKSMLNIKEAPKVESVAKQDNSISSRNDEMARKEASRWIFLLTKATKENTLNEKLSNQITDNFYFLSKRYGKVFEDQVEKNILESNDLKEFISNKIEFTNNMFDFKKMRSSLFDNTLFKRDVEIQISNKVSSTNQPEKTKSVEIKKNNKWEVLFDEKLNNKLVKDIKRKTFESTGIRHKTKPEKIDSINKFIENKHKKMDLENLFTINDFSNVFSNKLKNNVLLEATAWFSAYINSDEFSQKDLIFNNNGKIDTTKSIINISERINEISITANNPFKFENNKLQYDMAGGGEVDVMLFSEKTQTIIGSSATRDRTFRIEGNQFIRHEMRLRATSVLLEEKINNLNPNINKLKASDVKKIITHESFQEELNSKSVLSNNQNATKDVIDGYKDTRVSHFASHLTRVRENIYNKTGLNFHKNGINITEEEIAVMQTKQSKFDVKYNFFGEVNRNVMFPELIAGLNKISYIENMLHVAPFNMNYESSKKYLDSIDYRYNNINNLSLIDSFAHKFIHNVLSVDQDSKGLENLLSETFSYKDERTVAFKAIGTVLNQVNDLDDFSEGNIKKSLSKTLTTLNSAELDDISKSIKSDDFKDKLFSKLSTISVAQSEVPEDLMNLKRTIVSIERRNIAENNNNFVNSLSKYGNQEEILRKLELLQSLQNEDPNKPNKRNFINDWN